LADCLTAGWLLLKLFCLLTKRCSKTLHISFESLKLSSHVFILRYGSFAVNWRDSSRIFTAFEVFISIRFIRQEMNLLLILIFLVNHYCRIPRAQIVLRIYDIADS